MRLSDGSIWRMRSLGALLVLLALSLRLAVPTGYMLAGDGTLALVPCPATGAMLPSPSNAMGHGRDAHAMQTDGASHDPDRPDHSSTKEQCPFAAIAAPIIPPPPPALIARSPSAYLAPAIAAVHTGPPQLLAAPPPPSTGPPAVA